ncbi:MAG: hypothetical protein AB8E82_15310 [Aureispira sp.]
MKLVIHLVDGSIFALYHFNGQFDPIILRSRVFCNFMQSSKGADSFP